MSDVGTTIYICESYGVPYSTWLVDPPIDYSVDMWTEYRDDMAAQVKAAVEWLGSDWLFEQLYGEHWPTTGSFEDAENVKRAIESWIASWTATDVQDSA